MATSVRIDKWLWAARFFKTRALAAQACEIGRVEIAGQRLKPSRAVRLGDQLKITSGNDEFAIEVLVLSGTRGPASTAQTLYRESAESRDRRLKAAADRKAAAQFETLPPAAGRPTKRDRRRIMDLRGEN